MRPEPGRARIWRSSGALVLQLAFHSSGEQFARLLKLRSLEGLSLLAAWLI